MCGYFNKLPCVIVMGQFGDPLTDCVLSALESSGKGLNRKVGPVVLSFVKQLFLSTCYVPDSSDVMINKIYTPCPFETDFHKKKTVLTPLII